MITFTLTCRSLRENTYELTYMPVHFDTVYMFGDARLFVKMQNAIIEMNAHLPINVNEA